MHARSPWHSWSGRIHSLTRPVDKRWWRICFSLQYHIKKFIRQNTQILQPSTTCKRIKLPRFTNRTFVYATSSTNKSNIYWTCADNVSRQQERQTSWERSVCARGCSIGERAWMRIRWSFSKELCECGKSLLWSRAFAKATTAESFNNIRSTYCEYPQLKKTSRQLRVGEIWQRSTKYEMCHSMSDSIKFANRSMLFRGTTATKIKCCPRDKAEDVSVGKSTFWCCYHDNAAWASIFSFRVRRRQDMIHGTWHEKEAWWQIADGSRSRLITSVHLSTIVWSVHWLEITRNTLGGSRSVKKRSYAEQSTNTKQDIGRNILTA